MNEVCLYRMRKSKDDRRDPGPAGPPMMLESGSVTLASCHDSRVETSLQIKGVLKIEFLITHLSHRPDLRLCF